jgi:hypothetical protein
MDSKLPWALAMLIAVAFAAGACQPPAAALRSPPASPARSEGTIQCPEGKAARAGLQNFGAYIGTWQASRPRDVLSPSDYVIGTISGRVTVRCSSDGYVIVEEIRPLFDSPAGQAVRVALTDIPADGQKIYDHVHAGCRVLQYSSLELAHQLGAHDADGRVDITFTSDGAAYNPAAIKLITMDIGNALGADAIAC